jgi:hypothetical protein
MSNELITTLLILAALVIAVILRYKKSAGAEFSIKNWLKFSFRGENSDQKEIKEAEKVVNFSTGDYSTNIVNSQIARLEIHNLHKPQSVFNSLTQKQKDTLSALVKLGQNWKEEFYIVWFLGSDSETSDILDCDDSIPQISKSDIIALKQKQLIECEFTDNNKARITLRNEAYEIESLLNQETRDTKEHTIEETSVNNRLLFFGFKNQNDQTFGKNEFNQKIGFVEDLNQHVVLAPHHITFVAIPQKRIKQSSRDVLKSAKDMLELEQWYSRSNKNDEPKYWPYRIFEVPGNRRAGNNSFVWEEKFHSPYEDFNISTLAITAGAEILFSSAIPFINIHRNGTPLFRISNILAKCWAFSGLVAQFFHEIGYTNDAQLCISMVNTLNSHLSSFADDWLEPSDLGYWHDARLGDWSCHSQNLFFSQTINLTSMKPKEQPEFIKHFAEEISFAYNHDTPRCFEKKTGNIAQKYLK